CQLLARLCRERRQGPGVPRIFVGEAAEAERRRGPGVPPAGPCPGRHPAGSPVGKGGEIMNTNLVLLVGEHKGVDAGGKRGERRLAGLSGWTWESSNPPVATVVARPYDATGACVLIKAMGPGSAVITGRRNGLAETIDVLVMDPPGEPDRIV